MVCLSLCQSFGDYMFYNLFIKYYFAVFKIGTFCMFSFVHSKKNGHISTYSFYVFCTFNPRNYSSCRPIISMHKRVWFFGTPCIWESLFFIQNIKVQPTLFVSCLNFLSALEIIKVFGLNYWLSYNALILTDHYIKIFKTIL